MRKISMTTKAAIMAIIITAITFAGIFALIDGKGNEEPQPIPVTETEVSMTVDEFVSLPGDFYFIVKDIDTWGVLEADVYMEREIVEVAVCDDTENTICLFIKLDENEEPHYRKVTE